MPYRLRKRESPQEGVRRIAGEQINRAVREIADPGLDRHEAVHQVRKRCKKIRGLIRLVRPDFQAYQQENVFFRDAARLLSTVRDAQSVLETFDTLIDCFAGQVDASAFASVREQLTERRQRIADDTAGLARRMEQFRTRMEEARCRAEGWPVRGDGFGAVAGGLRKTYGRGRRAMRKAYRNPTAENFHEWRKRAKYHWYHARLLESIWRPIVSEHGLAASELSDHLGDAHDLAVLRATLMDDPAAFGEDRDVQAILALIEMRRGELRGQARFLGERLFAEKPGSLVRRFARYWDAWHGELDQSPLRRASLRWTAGDDR